MHLMETCRLSRTSQLPRRLWLIACGLLIWAGQPLIGRAQGQQGQLSVVRDLQLKGQFQLQVGDEITMTDVDGKQHRLRIQSNPARPIGLSGSDLALNEPARIRVRARVNASVLRTGMVLALSCELGKGGEIVSISEVRLLPIGSTAGGVSVNGRAVGDDLVEATVEGVIQSINARRLVLQLPRHDLVPRGSLAVDVRTLDEIRYETRSLRMLQAGDVIDGVQAAELSTGDTVVRAIEVELIDVRDDLQLTIDEQLQLKHSELSDEPQEPRPMESRHFRMVTDISDRQARILLDKLEAMFDLVASYYGRRPGTPIEVYVVADASRWDMSDWDPRVVAKLQQGEGTTVYRRVGSNQQAVVFSANNPDIVQHEAVHGFCFLTFQGTGPLWYAEGMAEMGQYWRADEVSVNADPAVIGYLRSRPPQPLASIINATRIEGETWKAYAWRWALCHFLASNPNYSDKFRSLGVALMREDPRASFEITYRQQARELTFEYEQFLSHLETGLRADLCSWQWQEKSRPASSGRTIQKKILAARGWQATGALVEQGITYETRTRGTWQLADDQLPVDADGDSEGRGRLVGVIMNDYRLSEEFELGSDSDFTAVSDGVLYVRCRERLSLIADNRGELEFAIRRKKQN
jgi:hypothetical protein